MQICSKCRRSVESNYSFCPYCSNSLAQQNSQQTSNTQNNQQFGYAQNSNQGFNQMPQQENSGYATYVDAPYAPEKPVGKSKKNIIVMLSVILIIAIIGTVSVFVLKGNNDDINEPQLSNNNEITTTTNETDDNTNTSTASKSSKNKSSSKSNGIGETIVKNSKENNFSIGNVTGSKYENDFFGIGCRLSGWIYSDKETMMSSVAEAKDLFTSGSSNEEISEALKSTDMYMDMQATATDGSNVNVIVEKIKDKSSTRNEKTLLTQIKLILKDQYSAMGIDLAECEIIECDFGGEDKYALHNVLSYDGVNMESYQLIFVNDTHAATVTITSHSVDEIEEILGKFYYL